MKKILMGLIIFFIFNLALIQSATEEITSNGFDPYIRIYYPDRISQLTSFDLKIDFLDSKLNEEIDFLRFNFEIPFTYILGEDKYPYNIEYNEDEFGNSGFRVEYDKQRTMSLPVVVSRRRRQSFVWVGLTENSDISYTSGDLRYDLKQSEGYFDSFPEGFELKSSANTNLIRKLENENMDILLKRLETPHKGKNIVIPSSELLDFGNYDFFFAQSINTIKSLDEQASHDFSFDGRDGIILSGCFENSNYDVEEKKDLYVLHCRYAGILIKENGVYGFRASTQRGKLEEEELDLAKAYQVEIMQTVLENYNEKSDFEIEQVEIEESNDLCGECKIGYVCGACGDCIRETESVDPKKVDVSFGMNIKNNNAKISNTIDSNLALTVFPDLKLNYNGEAVDYCDLKFPGLKIDIKGELISNLSYSGFTSGFASDKREKEYVCSIDDIQNPKCVFIVSPSDVKKYFSKEYENILQKFRFSTEINDNKFSEIAEITLVSPKKMELSLDSKGVEVQQGSIKVLEVEPKSFTRGKIILKTTLMGPGGIGLQSKSLNRNWILKSYPSGEKIKIGYKAPEMGNFDIASELSSLSMVELQKEAAKQIALDAVTAYAGEYAQGIEDLSDLGQISKEAGIIAKEFKAINGVRNLKGIDEAIPGLTDEVSDVTGQNDDRDESTWVENAADVGVVGISAAQTAVSVLTFIPNKIPYVNKLSAGVQSAFSAATNIWKANLKYISKTEKINRARELFYPVAILVTAQDPSGWTIQELKIFKIAYHELK